MMDFNTGAQRFTKKNCKILIQRCHVVLFFPVPSVLNNYKLLKTS